MLDCRVNRLFSVLTFSVFPVLLWALRLFVERVNLAFARPGVIAKGGFGGQTKVTGTCDLTFTCYSWFGRGERSVCHPPSG